MPPRSSEDPSPSQLENLGAVGTLGKASIFIPAQLLSLSAQGTVGHTDLASTGPGASPTLFVRH